MGNDCSDGSGEGSDETLLAVAEVVIGLDGLDLVVDQAVDAVPDNQVGEAAIEVSIEALEDSGQAGSSRMDLSQDLEGVVALLLH